jgi:hypothetical protein
MFKKFLVISMVLFVVVLVSGCNKQKETPVQRIEENKQVSPENNEQVQGDIYLDKCGVEFSKEKLINSEKYEVFASDDEFETIVCGYLVNEDSEQMLKKFVASYLRIVEFGNNKVGENLKQEIQKGNNVNRIYKNNVDFSLGCFENGGIKGGNNVEKYIDETTEKALLESSEENPVALILSFGSRKGTGCFCCNLAQKVRLIEE